MAISEKLYYAMHGIDLEKVYKDAEEQLTRLKQDVYNVVVIPKNATNGDVIKLLFPRTPEGVELDTYQDGTMNFRTTTDWWSTTYRREDKEV